MACVTLSLIGSRDQSHVLHLACTDATFETSAALCHRCRLLHPSVTWSQ